MRLGHVSADGSARVIEIDATAVVPDGARDAILVDGNDPRDHGPAMILLNRQYETSA